MKQWLISLLSIFTFTTFAQPVTSTFDTDNEGWRVVDVPLGFVPVFMYHPTGGNPNGCISARDAAIANLLSSTLYFVAPPKFLGNKSWAYNQTLRFDLRESTTNNPFSVDDVILQGANGVTLVADIGQPLTNWTTYTIPFIETSWRVGDRNGLIATRAQLQSVLCNISSLWIRAEYITGADEGFLDNVILGVAACTPNRLRQEIALCPGQSAVVNGRTISSAGLYLDTIKRCYPQCDSIIETQVGIINGAFTFRKDTAICPGGSVIVGSKTYTVPGIYKDTLRSLGGCDSVIFETNIFTRNPTRITQNVQICSGQVYRLGAKAYSQSGTYLDTFRTFRNCDSIITTNLTILPPLLVLQRFTICQGGSVTVGSKTYSQAGIFRDTLKAITGCDSIVTLNITVTPPLSYAQNLSICEGDFVQVGAKRYSQAGIFTDTIKTFSGCDSVVTTNLTFFKKYNETQTVSICPNSVYTIGTKRYTQEGIYRDTFKTINGCDSIIITDLSIKTSATKTQNVVLCTGQSFKIGIKTYTQAGLYRDTFRSASGCDSIIVTNLSFNPISVKNQTVEICQGESLRVGAKTYTASGIYRDTLLNATGCDSIITTLLTVLRTTFTNQNIALCTGQSYTIGSKTYTQAGIYRDTLRNFIGCDSVVITSLSIAPAITKAQSLTVCEGMVVRVGNSVYSRSGVYRDTLQSNAGCDSIVVTTLTVNPAPVQQKDTTVCAGNVIVLNGTTYSKSGTYRITIPRSGTCDSTFVLNLTVQALAIEKREITLCANDSVIINGKVWRNDGIVIDTSVKTSPCRSIIEWHIKKSPLAIDLGADISLIQGDSVQLTPSVTGALRPVVRWLPHPALSCVTCLTPIAKPSGSTVYTVQVTDSITGCRVRDSVRVSVRSCANTYLPTAFSPDKDGVNDYFAVKGFGCIKSIRRMQIFNRWGNLVYSKENISPSSEDEGWDGTMNNRLMPPDVYVYMVELELLNGKMEIVAGDVTLLR